MADRDRGKTRKKRKKSKLLHSLMDDVYIIVLNYFRFNSPLHQFTSTLNRGDLKSWSTKSQKGKTNRSNPSVQRSPIMCHARPAVQPRRLSSSCVALPFSAAIFVRLPSSSATAPSFSGLRPAPSCSTTPSTPAPPPSTVPRSVKGQLNRAHCRHSILQRQTAETKFLRGGFQR